MLCHITTFPKRWGITNFGETSEPCLAWSKQTIKTKMMITCMLHTCYTFMTPRQSGHNFRLPTCGSLLLRKYFVIHNLFHLSIFVANLFSSFLTFRCCYFVVNLFIYVYYMLLGMYGISGSTGYPVVPDIRPDISYTVDIRYPVSYYLVSTE